MQFSTLENGINSWIPGGSESHELKGNTRKTLRTHRDSLTILYLNGPISRSYEFTPKIRHGYFKSF